MAGSGAQAASTSGVATGRQADPDYQRPAGKDDADSPASGTAGPSGPPPATKEAHSALWPWALRGIEGAGRASGPALRVACWRQAVERRQPAPAGWPREGRQTQATNHLRALARQAALARLGALAALRPRLQCPGLQALQVHPRSLSWADSACLMPARRGSCWCAAAPHLPAPAGSAGRAGPEFGADAEAALTSWLCWAGGGAEARSTGGVATGRQADPNYRWPDSVEELQSAGTPEGGGEPEAAPAASGTAGPAGEAASWPVHAAWPGLAWTVPTHALLPRLPHAAACRWRRWGQEHWRSGHWPAGRSWLPAA